MDDFRIKYKNLSEIEKLKADLLGVLNEDATLEKQNWGCFQVIIKQKYILIY